MNALLLEVLEALTGIGMNELEVTNREKAFGVSVKYAHISTEHQWKTLADLVKRPELTVSLDGTGLQIKGSNK